MFEYKWRVSSISCDNFAEKIFFWFESMKFLRITLRFEKYSNEELLIIREPIFSAESYTTDNRVQAGEEKIIEQYENFIAEICTGYHAFQNPPTFSEFCSYESNISCQTSGYEVLAEGKFATITIENDLGVLREIFFNQMGTNKMEFVLSFTASAKCFDLLVNDLSIYREHKYKIFMDDEKDGCQITENPEHNNTTPF